MAGLIEYANEHFEAAQAALRAGDFATYGEENRLWSGAEARAFSRVSAVPELLAGKVADKVARGE